jgi:hypothetical protein
VAVEGPAVLFDPPGAAEAGANVGRANELTMRNLLVGRLANATHRARGDNQRGDLGQPIHPPRTAGDPPQPAREVRLVRCGANRSGTLGEATSEVLFDAHASITLRSFASPR